MSTQTVALTHNGIEELEQQVKQIVISIRSLGNHQEQETAIADGRPLAAASSTVMCPW